MTFSKTLVATSVATMMAVASAAQAKDPYVAGFERYAQEMQSANAATASTFDTYAKDVAGTLKKAGYIGPTLPLPEPVKVTDGVYTVVGSLIWHNPTNYGLNNNLTWMEFEDGVFVFNAGPNPAVAGSFHRMIKEHTNKPVKWVAVENSQGHAYLGSSYWVDVGVKNLYSHDVANQDFDQGFEHIKEHWGTRVGHEITDSARNVSDQFTEFSDKMVIDVGGGETVELLNFGPGHTPGSTLVYVPSRNLLLTGDVGYNSRMLALFSYTNTQYWVETFRTMMDYVPDDVLVIPGHGGPTDLATVKTDTHDYLVYMQKEVQKVIDQGGDISDAEEIDQSMYSDRSVYEQTYQNNARHIYKEMTGGDLGENFE
ncbi:MBL fold metallo-hydrolase [Thiomicrospira sp. WB1]|jgi:glyoxylase-like metal-dependent hydrolase (beta-lactamase superfamily II)|uniref:MBL fold metallo-hydrolase n=1 Tax=Thiomicrospira sp. WB1 TaxID=1685380 RepID=UPI0007471DB6|nr:MBL fold metallo-hydrolase [Thiomicrospira sp. WB1]KUJ71875.1 MBL fold metallo-hydrolase [Thiomicrospira sp. WB1]